MEKLSHELPSNRKFGFFFSFLFLCISIYLIYKSSNLLSIFTFIIFSVFILATLFIPNSLKPLNIAWFRIGFILGKIVSPIVLGFIFFILISPLAIILKISGRDELRIKMNVRKSEWKKRIPVGPSANSFKDQF